WPRARSATRSISTARAEPMYVRATSRLRSSSRSLAAAISFVARAVTKLPRLGAAAGWGPGAAAEGTSGHLPRARAPARREGRRESTAPSRGARVRELAAVRRHVGTGPWFRCSTVVAEHASAWTTLRHPEAFCPEQ